MRKKSRQQSGCPRCSEMERENKNLRREAEEALSDIRVRTAKYARYLLFLQMTIISEDAYCASWMSGLEYALWQMVEKAQGLAEFYGQTTVTSENINELRQLSEDAGGWMTFNTDTGQPDAKFVPMDEWLAMYQEWSGK